MMDEKEFWRMLRNESPILFTIAVLNARLLKDMEFGEIKLTEYIKNGKIYRIEASPTISKLIES
jgi:hypothetical protein